MKDIKSDLIYLQDICKAISEIESFVEEGLRDLKTYRAVERNLKIIGEASSRISDEIKRGYPEIEWREIKSMRNLIDNECSRVCNDMVWNFADNNLDSLLEDVQKIIQKYGS